MDKKLSGLVGRTRCKRGLQMHTWNVSGVDGGLQGVQGLYRERTGSDGIKHQIVIQSEMFFASSVIFNDLCNGQ